MQDIQDKSKEARDPQLNAVRAAIAAFMPGFEGLGFAVSLGCI